MEEEVCVLLRMTNSVLTFSLLVFSSPPFASVLVQFGRTEVIDNTLNPDFVRKYILDYFFEEKQSLRFDVWVSLFDPALSEHTPRCVCDCMPFSNIVLKFIPLFL